MYDMPLKCFQNPCCVKKTLLMAFMIVAVVAVAVLVIILSQLCISVLSKFLLQIKISCFCNILININNTHMRTHTTYRKCNVANNVYSLTFWCWPNVNSVWFCNTLKPHHLKIAIQYIVCICICTCTCIYIDAHRFHFQISIWFLFAYYNIPPVHSFIRSFALQYIFIRSFHLYILCRFSSLFYSRIIPFHSLFHFNIFVSLNCFPHFCALDRQAEIHFICHTINVIIGNLQKRFLFLLHSRNWIYFFIFFLCVPWFLLLSLLLTLSVCVWCVVFAHSALYGSVFFAERRYASKKVMRHISHPRMSKWK